MADAVSATADSAAPAMPELAPAPTDKGIANAAPAGQAAQGKAPASKECNLNGDQDAARVSDSSIQGTSATATPTASSARSRRRRRNRSYCHPRLRQRAPPASAYQQTLAGLSSAPMRTWPSIRAPLQHLAHLSCASLPLHPPQHLALTKWRAKIVPPANSTNKTAWDNRGHYVSIIGLDVDGSKIGSGTKWVLGIYTGGSYNVIEGNRVHHMATTIPCNSAGGSAIGGDSYYAGVKGDVAGNVVHDMGPAGCTYVQGIYHSTSIKKDIV